MLESHTPCFILVQLRVNIY